MSEGMDDLNPAGDRVDCSRDNEEESEEDASVIDNIIPVKQLSHGWKVIQGWAVSSAQTARDKMNEINNSEKMESLRTSTAAVVKPAWDTTVETTGTVWEKSKELASQISERSQETVGSTKVTAEKFVSDLKPTAEKVSNGAKRSWAVLSETVVSTSEKASAFTRKAAEDIQNSLNERNSSNSSQPMTV
mmetsp:Transcript_16035/g.24179  ORF Transcript_16035/g.24179 Transcript_16035/m.24179 type:complete len:189 (+) Transcript_16035:16-582(+)